MIVIFVEGYSTRVPATEKARSPKIILVLGMSSPRAAARSLFQTGNVDRLNPYATKKVSKFGRFRATAKTVKFSLTLNMKVKDIHDFAVLCLFYVLLCGSTTFRLLSTGKPLPK